MIKEYIELGAVAVIFILAIKDFFKYLTNKDVRPTHDKKVLEELRAMNSNHLHTIENAIREGNRDIVKSINSGNMKLAQLLGEIKGSIRK